MSRWNNYSIRFTDESAYNEVKEAFSDDTFIFSANDADLILKFTDFSGDDISVNSLKRKLNNHMEDISSLIHVNANDTSDTASGVAYNVEGSSFDKVRSESSGGQDSRHNWHGIHHDAMRLSGAKY